MTSHIPRINALIFFTTALASAGDAPIPTWKSATVKQPINVVRLQRSDGPESAAKRGDQVTGDDNLKTAQKSMVDVAFDDQKTVALLGERTKFTFNPQSHELSVPDGLTLLTVRDGQLTCVGCALKTISSSTAFIESFAKTNQVTGEASCATKFILLEGNATVSKLDGSQSKKLRGGQMIIYSDDQDGLPEPDEVDIKRLVEESRLITVFQQSLPSTSMDKIQRVIDQQQKDLWRGRLERTRFTIGGRGRDRYVDPLAGRTDLEAPFDPDLPGAIIIQNVPCPLCP